MNNLVKLRARELLSNLTQHTPASRVLAVSLTFGLSPAPFLTLTATEYVVCSCNPVRVMYSLLEDTEVVTWWSIPGVMLSYSTMYAEIRPLAFSGAVQDA